MNFKKRVNGSWANTPHYIHNTSEDTITTLPAVIHPTDTTATVGLKGQTLQSSVPSPTSPVMPQGTGERTGNLFDMSTVENEKSIAMDGSITNYTRRCSTVTPIDVSTYNNVTLAFTASLSRTRVIYALFNDSTLVTRRTAVFSGTMIDVSSGNKLYICFYDPTDTETVQKSDLSNVMLNLGSEALPYENFGYKIPISSANTTTPVYLGEVETTRKIRKYVCTGQESIFADLSYSRFIFTLNGSLIIGVRKTPAFCTHWQVIDDGRPIADVPNNALYSDTGNSRWFIKTTDYTTADGVKSYLAQQYANGTPVTIWYVLANEETAVVNEPLMKIGGYADEVSGISIPVTAGGDTLSVDTTVQPSEITVNYTGWHPVQSVHERDNEAWT